ncbi:DUF1329 domain-containing protein [Halomonas sp. H5]|uniref:DUF1329 domain-containing protein n=1 Tax=Halomonas sp. H5 TaxID=3423910 RepID=UPI003D368CF4
MKQTLAITSSLMVALSTATVQAAVSPEEAERLGNDLTCVGAVAAGNEAGTIPPFSGHWLGKPPHVDYELHSGQHPVDPYPEDTPTLVIDGQNFRDYADNLTDGQIAMFERYPETFRMPVYPGRRDFRYPDEVCEVARRNALEAELTDGGLGYTGYNGAIPFPIPSSAMEVLANHNNPYLAYTEANWERDIANVNSGGDITWGRQVNITYNATTHPDNVGLPHGDSTEGVMAYSFVKTLLPARDRGNATVAIEPNSYARDRLAWSYNPGTRRVRQAPEFGFDSPMPGTSGMLTIDQDRLMNGSPERYDWALLGQREIYVPANAYRLHSEDVSYDDLLQTGHANPDEMRYELRRVWVIEGTLKDDYRHKFGKRTLYIDEDTWHGVVGDYYDTRGTLVQHGFINYYYAFDLNAWHAGTSFYHDLTTGGYLAFNLFQDLEEGPELNRDDLPVDMFTPAALRRSSH